MKTVKKLSAEEATDLEEQVSLPYRVEDATVLSEGQWNGLQWTAQELREAVQTTDFTMDRDPGDQNPPNASLFYDHEDRSADSYVGRVENVRMEGDDVVTDLVITDKQAAMNIEHGAPFGVSPKADGKVDEENVMQDFEFENFSLVINPAVKTTWLNEDLTTLLDELEVHRPAYQSVGDSDFTAPNLSDFVGHSNYDELSEEQKMGIGKHFLVSKSGFPAESYTDYSLPVVTSDGELNRQALQQAKSRVSQVSGIEEDEIERVEKLADNLANGNFEDADFGEQKFVSMQEMDYEMHRPEFNGLAANREWSRPNLEDFDVSEDTFSELPDEEKEMVANNFVLSSSGFPPENYGDLSLPVVFPDNELSLSALANAKARVSQVEGISDEMVTKVKKMLTQMANENFDNATFDPVEMAEDMPVGEDDWVQWNPEEAIEAHGKVIRVIEPDSEDEQLQVDVRMYIQDEDGVWHPTGDVRRKDMDEVGPWGNTPSEDFVSDERLEDVTNASPVRKFDPDEDPEDVSESIRDAIENSDMEELISDNQEEVIESKVEEHNEKHGDEEGKKVTKSMLIEVYERGMGAYQDTHRPGMSPQQWSMARVNAFLYLVRNGNPENDAYTQDNDLLPDGHPKKGETESSENDTKVKNPMAEEETKEPEAEESSEMEEDSAEDYVTADELEDFKSEVVDSLKQELGDEEEEGAGNDVEESEVPDTELSEFEEFRKQNPEMSLSEAAEKFEESNKDVEDRLDEVVDTFEQKISDLEDKLEEKEEEVEQLSEEVSNPKRATQASGEEETEDLREKVSNLSDEELHAQVFQQMDSERGVTATKEMINQ